MNGKKIGSNVVWRFLEKIGASGVSFIVSIILARILDPTDYGTVALVTVIITVLNVFINSGMGTALIQKKNADELDFSTVFFFNIVMCTVLYFLMFFSAPLIASYYEIPELVKIVRVISLLLEISGLKNIQHAYVSKHLLFKRFFFATLFGTIVAAVIGIYMAYHGFGVWAIVAQELINAAIDTLILWITVKWRPKLQFSFLRLKSLLSYGWKILVSELLETVYARLVQLIIGKKYSSADLAYYNRGDTFPSHVVTSVNLSIDSVLLPVMSDRQDNSDSVKAVAKKAVKLSTYMMLPLMVGLFVCAEPLISVLLTDKWLPCVPFLRIMSFIYAFKTVHTTNLNAIKAVGRSDIIMKQQMVKKLFGIVVMFGSMFFGTIAMAHGLILIDIFAQIVDAWPSKKLVGYSYFEQIKDILPNFLAACVMGVPVYLVTYLGINNILTLIIQVFLGGLIYLSISVVFKMEPFEYLKKYVLTLKK